MRIVVMGVSGSGKTVIGEALAARLSLPYADGDEFHSTGNVAKMSGGIALDDSDRAPWLDAVGAWLARQEGVVSCSALRRAYRDRLRTYAPDAFFVQLDVPEDLLKTRLDARQGHFMKSALLRSQLATLESLQADENGMRITNAGESPEAIAAKIPV